MVFCFPHCFCRPAPSPDEFRVRVGRVQPATLWVTSPLLFHALEIASSHRTGSWHTGQKGDGWPEVFVDRRGDGCNRRPWGVTPLSSKARIYHPPPALRPTVSCPSLSTGFLSAPVFFFGSHHIFFGSPIFEKKPASAPQLSHRFDAPVYF